MRTLNLNEMENVNGGKVAPDCWGAFAAVVVGAIGAPLSFGLGAGLIAIGSIYIDENC